MNDETAKRLTEIMSALKDCFLEIDQAETLREAKDISFNGLSRIFGFYAEVQRGADEYNARIIREDG